MMLKNFLRIAFKYCKHNLVAKSKKGHGIHSPLVFGLCQHVFSKKTKAIKEIESLRKQLVHSKEKITFTEIGAGSAVGSRKVRKVSEIAKFSSNKKVNMLLFRLVAHMKPEIIIEFGTSFGFSTMYMAKALENVHAVTVEGVPEIAEIARKNFKDLNLLNVKLIKSDFDDFLDKMQGLLHQKSIVFLDGNHKKEATIKYFNYVAKHISDDSVIVIDDINWSEGMDEAWQAIKQSEKVTFSIDLFFVGIVFFKKSSFKQNFNIRF